MENTNLHVVLLAINIAACTTTALAEWLRQRKLSARLFASTIEGISRIIILVEFLNLETGKNSLEFILIGGFLSAFASGIWVLETMYLKSLFDLQMADPRKYYSARCKVRALALVDAVLSTAAIFFLSTAWSASSQLDKRAKMEARVAAWTQFFLFFVTLQILMKILPLILARRGFAEMEEALSEDAPMAVLQSLWSLKMKSLMLAVFWVLTTSMCAATAVMINVAGFRADGFIAMHVFLPMWWFLCICLQLTMTFQICCRIRSSRKNWQSMRKSGKLNVRELVKEGVKQWRNGENRQKDMPPMWVQGVSCAFLQSMIASNRIAGDLTTEEVVEKFVRPQTAPAKCSYWEAVWRSGSKDTSMLCGQSMAMVSHAWSYKFVDLVSILTTYEAKHGSGGSSSLRMYFFLDAFCLNQHLLSSLKMSAQQSSASQQKVYDMLLQTLTNSIVCPGNMVMVLDPWFSPSSLQRCWCLYELYVAHQSKSVVTLAFDEDAGVEYLAAHGANPNIVEEIVAAVDVETAQATNEEDRTFILTRIKERIGADAFNSLVRHKLTVGLYLAAVHLMTEHEQHLPQGAEMMQYLNSNGADVSFQFTSSAASDVRKNATEMTAANSSITALPISMSMSAPTSRRVGAMDSRLTVKGERSGFRAQAEFSGSSLVAPLCGEALARCASPSSAQLAHLQRSTISTTPQKSVHFGSSSFMTNTVGETPSRSSLWSSEFVGHKSCCELTSI